MAIESKKALGKGIKNVTDKETWNKIKDQTMLELNTVGNGFKKFGTKI